MAAATVHPSEGAADGAAGRRWRDRKLLLWPWP